jgi:monofunctional biosynthetic peptidoglycan transglycosylase
MATKITSRKSRQPVKKEPTSFMSKLTRFLFKVMKEAEE